jgi:hypothetical protein
MSSVLSPSPHFMSEHKGTLQSVIPGLTRNPVFFWIPAFAGMTFLEVALINRTIGFNIT